MTMCLRKYMKRLYDGLCFKMFNIEGLPLTEFNTLMAATQLNEKKDAWLLRLVQRQVFDTLQ